MANPFQPRREFDEAKLQELSESVRMYGILQPLTVTRKEIERDDGAFYTEYELIAGERRLRAARMAGLQQVPVIIRDGESNEQEKLELAIIENLQREDLNAVDRALAFKQLAETFNLSHAKVAAKVGRSREYVSNTLRLLLLPEHMLDGLKRGDIAEGHARTLLMLSDRPEELETVYKEVVLKKLSVRELERIVRKIANDRVRNQKYKETDPSLVAYEAQLTETLGTRVQIAKTDFGGKITIDYFTEDDLNKLLTMLRAEEDAPAAPAQEGGASDTASMAALEAHSGLSFDAASEQSPAADADAPHNAAPDEPVESGVPAPEPEETPSRPDAQPAAPQPHVSPAPATDCAPQQSPAAVAAPTPAEASRAPLAPPPRTSGDDSAGNSSVNEPETDRSAHARATEAAPASAPEHPAKDAEEETELYSIRNFHL